MDNRKMSYENEMIDVEGYPSAYPSAPGAYISDCPAPPPQPADSTAIYENPIDLEDLPKYWDPNPSAPSAYISNGPGPPPRPANLPIIFKSPIYPKNPPKYCDPMPKLGVVTTQPTMVDYPPSTCKDYLVWSIVNLIFFNLIFGIVALIFSLKTRKSVRSGDSTLAASYSRRAFIFNLTALILGIILHVAWIAVVISLSTETNIYNAINIYAPNIITD